MVGKKLLLIILFLFFITPQVFAKNLRIVQITDVHYRSGYNDDVLIETIKKVNALDNVDFITFTGDNIDKSNYEDLEKFLKIVSDLKRPYYLLMGNHDSHSISGLSKSVYMDCVVKNNKNQSDVSPSYTFYPTKKLAVVFLDGVTPLAPSTHGYFSVETLEYLDKILLKNRKKKVLIFQHFPLVPPSKENPSHEILEIERYNEVMNKHNNVVMIASGHYHTNWETVDEKGIHHISTTSLGKHKGFNQIDINYSKRDLSDLNIKVTHFEI